MATVHVTFGSAMDKSIPAIGSVPNSAETITSSSSSAATTATAGQSAVCTVTASGGSVWVKFGDTPVAAAGSDHLLIDGQTRDFGSLTPTTKVAVIDV